MASSHAGGSLQHLWLLPNVASALKPFPMVFGIRTLVNTFRIVLFFDIFGFPDLPLFIKEIIQTFIHLQNEFVILCYNF